MADTRRRTRDAVEDELEPPTRVVTPRRSNTPEQTEPTEHAKETEPSEDSEPEEEETHPTLSGTPHSVPTPIASPSPSTPHVPTSPILPSSSTRLPTVPTTTFTSYRPADPLRWDWMPTVLAWWRTAERIPILPEVPGSQMPHPLLTQESIHDTIPVLITRLLSHDHQLELLERATHDNMDAPPSDVEHIQHQVSGIENDLLELRDEVVTTRNEGVDNHEEVEALTQRVQSAEDRAEAAENRAQRLEGRLNAMEQEIVAMRADRDQLREATMYATRLVDRLEGLCERLR